MLNSACNSSPLPTDDGSGKKRQLRPKTLIKRSHSVSPNSLRPQSPLYLKKYAAVKRYHSLSSRNVILQLVFILEYLSFTPLFNFFLPSMIVSSFPEKDLSMPHCVLTKTMRALTTKKREFIKLRKNLISQQNLLLETYASLKELETKVGVTDDHLGDIRLLSVSNWPAHDLLLLVRNDLATRQNLEIRDGLAPQVLQQLHAQLKLISEEVLNANTEIIARRNEILNLMRTKYRADRSTYLTNLEWKNKNLEFDEQTERINNMATDLAQNLEVKINQVLDLAKIPWVDREALVKKVERLQNENSILQQKIEDISKQNGEDCKEEAMVAASKYEGLCEELTKERTAKEALKEVVSAAESMLRVARARISTLERQLKETKSELETARRKHKELEQLYRHRETSYDTRAKKLLEVSKTGEMTIETLSQQRDALELRVKELREQAEAAEKAAADREDEQRSRVDYLQAKVAEKEKARAEAELHVDELRCRIKELEEELSVLRERCAQLVDIEKQHCLEYLPAKENEPSDRETEIWKELQITRAALSRVEDELRQSRADKDSFLNSLSRIAQEEGDKEDKMATELLDREQKISRLQLLIEEQRENEKIMEQGMTDYENQLAALRLEVKRLKNYDFYARDTPYQDLQTELLEMQMQVATLKRERSALVTAAASRALMLERHERAADLFAKVTRARRELAAQLEDQSSRTNEDIGVDVSRSLSSLCANAADTWSALQSERARVIQLESAVLAQSLQLEREGRVRTQLERRRALLEREIIRTHHTPISECSLMSNRSLLI
ncbi:unnamed protein product [Parnassius mnemosyne]|uniref:E3 ubiquitin protein ligase n=1 Tax=Parnassius mnemosyne TaxID=213953 RepID=A0AAV1K8J2_9NEOP